MEIVCSLFKVCSRPHLHLLLFGDLRDKNKGRLLFIGGGGAEKEQKKENRVDSIVFSIKSFNNSSLMVLLIEELPFIYFTRIYFKQQQLSHDTPCIMISKEKIVFMFWDST